MLDSDSSCLKISAYEKTWQEVIKERRRRNGYTDSEHHSGTGFNPNSQLQLLTEIKNCVNTNNNLIKRRLDPSEIDSSDIRILAEKNFSELSRLSKMADRSVRLLSGQDTRKHDLNPTFDSENNQERKSKMELYKDHIKLVIPDISRIVSLKTAPESVAVERSVATSTQATSMDEPESSAAGVGDAELLEPWSKIAPLFKNVGCQTEIPGLVEAFMKTYKLYDLGEREFNS